MHPNLDRQIANVQHIYGIPPKKNKKLDRITPIKSNKKYISLDVEGESKPIIEKSRKPQNIFQAQAENALNDLGLPILFFFL